VSKFRAISYELRSLETSPWSPQNSSKTKIFIKKKPMPVLAVALSKHRAFNFELISSETS
jgi:hypothetical protein